MKIDKKKVLIIKQEHQKKNSRQEVGKKAGPGARPRRGVGRVSQV